MWTLQKRTFFMTFIMFCTRFRQDFPLIFLTPFKYIYMLQENWLEMSRDMTSETQWLQNKKRWGTCLPQRSYYVHALSQPERLLAHHLRHRHCRQTNAAAHSAVLPPMMSINSFVIAC